MKFHTCAACLAVVAGVLSIPPARATDISTGFDLLETRPGAFFDATAFGLGIIPMIGREVGPAFTDTIYSRDNGFTCSIPPCFGNTVNIHVFAMSLESAAPINIGGSFFDLFYDINDTAGLIPLSTLPQPDVLNPSTGTYTIDELGSVGTYDLSLTISADVILSAVGQGPNYAPALGNSDCSQVVAIGGCHFSAPTIAISATGGTWQTTPVLDDAHNATFPAGSFYVSDTGNVTGPLPNQVALTPEPAAFVPLAATLCAFALRRRRL